MVAGTRYAKNIINRLNNPRIKLFLMAVPFIVLIFVIYYIPLGGWIIAFFRYRPGIALFDSEFIGLQNFRILVEDSDTVRVLGNTMAMSMLRIIVSVVPVVLAVMITEVRWKPFKKAVQTMTTLPNFISWVIVYSLAFTIFSTEGVYNQFLDMFGLLDGPTNLLGNSKIVWLFQTSIALWKETGWSSIIYLAAISSISSELYEAAEVDGAGRFAKIWHITIPGVMPTYIVLLLLTISNLLSAGSFEQYLVFHNSLVAQKIEVLDYHVYRLGIVTADYSYSTAVGILKTLVSVTLLFSVNTISKKARGNSIV